MKFSANLGFLWNDLPIDVAIKNAAEAGFLGVEAHWPYDFDPSSIIAALKENNLEFLSLNTKPGDLSAGEFGFAAIAQKKNRAKEHIEEAISFAHQTGCQMVHVMSGKAEFSTGTFDTFCENLEHATRLAAEREITILIEPINRKDVPGYFLSNLDDAVKICEEIKSPNLKIMFDCYHIEIIHGNLLEQFRQNFHRIGHVQFASVPSRNEPQFGKLNYPLIFETLQSYGWTGFLGAEYRPKSDICEGLVWLKSAISRK
ncbi:MAG: TIM barrel protein [Pseudomonadota bacterium]